MDVAVGDHDRAADPLRRRVGERVAQRGEQPRAFGVGLLARGFDDAQVDVAERLEARLDLVPRLVGLARAAADFIALRAVDDDRDDILERPPVLLHEPRIAQVPEARGRRRAIRSQAPRVPRQMSAIAIASAATASA